MKFSHREAFEKWKLSRGIHGSNALRHFCMEVFAELLHRLTDANIFVKGGVALSLHMSGGRNPSDLDLAYTKKYTSVVGKLIETLETSEISNKGINYLVKMTNYNEEVGQYKLKVNFSVIGESERQMHFSSTFFPSHDSVRIVTRRRISRHSRNTRKHTFRQDSSNQSIWEWEYENEGLCQPL